MSVWSTCRTVRVLTEQRPPHTQIRISSASACILGFRTWMVDMSRRLFPPCRFLPYVVSS